MVVHDGVRVQVGGVSRSAASLRLDPGTAEAHLCEHGLDMPLRAVLAGDTVHAFQLDADAWAELRRTYRARELRTACCGNPAIPKRSPLGTQFFAHAKRGDCTSAPETKEHLLAKSTIATAALAAGWHVTTECAGATPDGAPWIADVLAERNGTRVAFEVQWSRQTIEDYRTRQARYARAGVRTAWLVRRMPLEGGFRMEARADHELPIFLISIRDDGGSFEVPRFGVGLEVFVTGMLAGSLRWAPRVGRRYELGIVPFSQNCWRCGKPTGVVIAMTLKDPELGQIGYQVAVDEEELRFLDPFLTKDVRRRYGLGVIKPRFSHTLGDRYLSQGCSRCDALMGMYYLEELALEVSAGSEEGDPEGLPVGEIVFTRAHEAYFYPDWRWVEP